MFDSETALQQALLLHQAGRLPEAGRIYHQILKIEPGNADALNLLGVMASQAGSHGYAVDLITRAIQNNSAKSSYYNNLANALVHQEELDKSIEAYGRALDIRPNYPEACNNLGVALKKQGKLDEAIASFRRSLEMMPDYVEAQDNLGSALNAKGALEEARAAHRRSLEINSFYTEAYRHLALLKHHVAYNDEIQAMEKMLARSDLADAQRMHLYFGLGKAFEDLGEHEKAFNFLRQGNRLRRNTFSYSISDDEAYFNKIKNVFDRKLFQTFSGGGHDDSTPIFIVGMPRSGSTLIEQILSSHHHVYGAGEINDLEEILTGSSHQRSRDLFPEGVPALNREDLSRLGADYVMRVRRHSANARYIANKMLHNFLYIGMIRLALPHAKIIHCKRYSMDTCFSCFKTYFTGDHKFAYNLIELGKYYNLYQDLMSHWHAVLPGWIYDVQYEDIIADQEAETRRLLGFCELKWNRACMSFHKSERPVGTASSVQVRRPIYSSSVRLWEKYAKQLKPLLMVLEQE